MSNVLEYKCPCCGGAISFDTASQKMKCPYCDTEFELETLKEYDEDLKDSEKESDMTWKEAETNEWSQGETSGMKVYSCKSCGGEIVCDETTSASSCPYCGSPVIMTDKLVGGLKPDYVIPFKLDKKAAKDKFSEYLCNKRLLPKVFKDENHLDEIKGVYAPFWLFDATADASIRYSATRVSSWSDAKYIYTKTDYYRLVRKGSMSFQHVPADGSSKLNDALMDSLEPFDFGEAVEFQTAYLSGFMADKYDVSREECIKRANRRIMETTSSQFRGTASGYNSVNEETATIDLKDSKCSYALYPVWLLSTTWNGENYLFAMNGQTGKFTGNLPLDRRAYWIWFIVIAIIVVAVVFGLGWLIF